MAGAMPACWTRLVAVLVCALAHGASSYKQVADTWHYAEEHNGNIGSTDAGNQVDNEGRAALPNIVMPILQLSSVMDFQFAVGDDEDKAPDMWSVALVALAGFVLVIFLDVVGHVVEEYIEDPQEKEHVDHIIDGSVAFLGFLVASIWYGLIQEYILTQEYSTGKFPSPAFLVVTTRLMIIPMAVALMACLGHMNLNLEATGAASVPGVTSGVASVLDQVSLTFITYPVQSVFKSCSLIPTMAMNTLVNGERQGWKEYMAAVFITANVAGFSLASQSDDSVPKEGMAIGICMVITYMLLLAAVAAIQKKIFNDYQDFTSVHMMFVSSIWSALFAMCVVMCTLGLIPLVEFVRDNPRCILHLVGLGFSGALGLFFIFYIIKHQGPVALTIMQVAKTIISVVFSSWLYGHPLPTLAKVCALGAAVGVLLATYFAHRRHRQEATKRRTGVLRSMLRATAELRRQISKRTTDGTDTADKEPYGTFQERDDGGQAMRKQV